MHITVVDSSSAGELADKMTQGCWVVLYFAEWCGHCHEFRPAWEDLKPQLATVGINSAEVESSNMDKLVLPQQINGYPTIRIFNNSELMSDYDGERTPAAIMETVKVYSIPKVAAKKAKGKKKTRKSSTKKKSTAHKSDKRIV